MRKCKRLIHKHFGGLGNFLMIIVLVAVTVIFINTYVLTRTATKDYLDNEISASSNKKNTNSEIPEATKNAIPPSGREPIRRPITPDPGCEIEETCPEYSIPYKVVSGEGLEKYPTICFNNKLYVHKNLKDSKIGRGVNVAAFDGKTYEHKLTETFDTYIEDTFFLRTLKMNLNDGDIFILASFDEMTYGLTETTSTLLEKYGSQLIKIIKFRDAFVMMGQKGLARGKAIEMHQPKSNRDFSPAAHISGCARFPLGVVTQISFPAPEINKDDKIAVAASINNCGLTEKCLDNQFPVHVYTGRDNNDEPKICVDGKYVIAKGINDAGRGLNIAVVSNGKEVIRTGHFDTWQEDSTNLEIFLENLEDNVILIAVTFDEASTNLRNFTRIVLETIGSQKIGSLKFRDGWALVHHLKTSIDYHFEEISYAGNGNTYAPPIDKRMCVPQTLKGFKIRPDPLPFRNDKRRDFCSRYDGYGDFCTDTNVDKSLVPVALLNKTLEDNPIFSTPILIIAGISHNALRMCLETLLMQPGLIAENVIVTVDEKFSEPLALIDLFGFRGIKTTNNANYMEHYEKSLTQIWDMFPNKDSVIVIEEDLLLSPDFLYTLALLSETFRTDSSVSAVQMWNPNSYDIVNGSIEVVYRVNDFMGLGYLLKRSFYEKEMKSSFKTCCSKRVWDKWKFSDVNSFLMPEVSRVFRRPVDGHQKNSKYLDALFNRKRKTSLVPFPPVWNIEKLKSDKYEQFLKDSIRSAALLKSLEKCDDIHTTMFSRIASQNSSTSFKFVYEQESTGDSHSLSQYLPCFGLFSEEPLGIYQDILFFTSNRYSFFLIGSKSPIYTSISRTS